MSYVKIGVGGPVGSGKTALIERLTREMSKEYSICVVREDCSMNLEAVDEMVKKHPDTQIVFIESGGDNLSATFSPDLADASIYVIDVAQGEKIPRKGGPGVTRSDLLVINKTDLAPLVGASLEVMASDSKRMRGDRPFLFTNLMSREGVSQVIDWIKKSVLFEDLK